MALEQQSGGAEAAGTWDLLDEGKVETVIKEGELRKRAIGKGRLGRTNWRTRWFRLTESGLSYYAEKLGEVPKGAIRLEQMHLVRKSKQIPFSFELIHYHYNEDTGEIRQKEYMLLCDAGSDYKRDEWILALKEQIHATKGLGRTQSMVARKVSPTKDHDAHEWRPEPGPQIGEPRERLGTKNFSGFEEDEVERARVAEDGDLIEEGEEEETDGFGDYVDE